MIGKVKSDLEQLGAKVTIRRRKLATGHKHYLTVKADGGHAQFFYFVLPTIRKSFPDAYMTSGGFAREMNVTVALEK